MKMLARAMRLILCLSIVLAGPALAAEPPAQGSGGAKATAQKATGKKSVLGGTDLGLSGFGELPKGEGLVKPEEKPTQLKPTVSQPATYQVLEVIHAKAFIHMPTGVKPAGAPLEAISLEGSPPMTERFSTAVRVKSPQRAGTAIEIAILDSRGESMMNGTGEIRFSGKREETDYTIEWTPTPLPGAGEYQLQVRLGGQLAGQWPLRIVDSGK